MVKKMSRPTNRWPSRLKALRARLDITQADLAARVRVSRRAYGKWERGEQVPSASHQLLIELIEAGKI